MVQDMSNTNPQLIELTAEQEKLEAHYTPKIPEGLSGAAKALFLKAVSKITFAPHESGGVSVSYEQLSEEELFAIGITGASSWPMFVPKSVKEKMKAMQPHRLLGVFPATHPDLLDAQNRVRELERKEALVKNHGNKFLPKRAKGSISKKTKYIHKLATDSPKEKALALYIRADKTIIGDMSEGTFANHVSDARNLKS